MYKNSAISLDAYDANVWCSVGVMLFLITLVTLFGLKWRYNSIPIMQVLTILLINEILYSLTEVLGYIDNSNNVLCIISMIGRMSFTVAANFWIIFITRLIYREALAPGKFFNLVHFVFKNIIFTYIPSLILSIFLLVIINISATDSEKICWQVVTNRQVLDYVIFGTTFLLPNLATSIIIIIYMLLFYHLPSRKWTFFLLFPITSLIFSIYYMSIKFYQLFNQDSEMGYFNLAMLGQPIVYGVFYIIVYIRQKRKETSSSDITIRGSDGEASFIDDL